MCDDQTTWTHTDEYDPTFGRVTAEICYRDINHELTCKVRAVNKAGSNDFVVSLPTKTYCAGVLE